MASANSTQRNSLAVAAFNTLLADASPYDQRDAADALKNFSKQQNSKEMIALTQFFSKQLRSKVRPILYAIHFIVYQINMLLYSPAPNPSLIVL